MSEKQITVEDVAGQVMHGLAIPHEIWDTTYERLTVALRLIQTQQRETDAQTCREIAEKYDRIMDAQSAASRNTALECFTTIRES